MVNEKIHKTIAYFLLILLFLSLLLTLASFIYCHVTVMTGGCYGRYLTVDEIEPNLDCLEFEENTCVGRLTVLNKCDKEVVLVGVANYIDSGTHVKEMHFNETIRNQPGFKENFLTLKIPPQSSSEIISVLDLVLQNQSIFSDGDDVEWNITAIYDGQNYTIHGWLTSNDNDGFDLCYLLNIFGVFSLFLLIATIFYWKFYKKKIKKYEAPIQKNLNIYCKNCGRLIDSNYKLCPYCGKTINDKKDD